MGDTLPLRRSTPPASSLGDKWEAAGVKKGDMLAGRYRVDDVLGFGGMGAVLATTHVQLGSRVAIKLVRGQAKQAYVAERFVREARAASKLRGPNAVRVFDVGRLDNGVPYMVMELLEGTDLKELLAKRGTLDPSIAADCIVQACRAVAEAHSHGIVHRDLKPANLFLTHANVVKVLDFGISKFLMPNTVEDAMPLTNPETTLGSPKYMAPEQLVRPNEVDERADVWSLGVTLYELLVGKAPFRGPSDEYIARAVMVEYPMPPSMVKPDIPEALSNVVMRCLEKDKKARFSSAAELGNAIEQAMAITTRTPSFSPPPLMPTLITPPPPPMQAATIPPHADLEPPPTPKRRTGVLLAIGFLVMAILGAAGVLLVIHEQKPDHVVATSASTVPISTSATTTSALAVLPATDPTLSSVAPLKNTSTVTDPKPTGKAPDPMCYAANIVCKRSYPECQSLKDYCEGKVAHLEVDSGAPLPGESPICTAARIVCDHKLEECESLTKKCLIAQQSPQ